MKITTCFLLFLLFITNNLFSSVTGENSKLFFSHYNSGNPDSSSLLANNHETDTEKNSEANIEELSVFPVSDSSNFSDTSKKSESEFKPNVRPELNIPRVPNGSIIIDGNLTDEKWKDAVIADNFTEISPKDNVKPEVETKVYVAYDDDAIYFGYICYEDMSTLRASMTTRDRMYQDDWVGPFIDTYNDQKQGYEFYVNPYGIQGDLFWTANNEDSSPDYIWQAETKIYDDRWTAEIRIPFKTLKFKEKDEQIWRVHLLRNRYRGARQEIYWASVSRDNPNFLEQAGILKGIKKIKSGNHLEILPYVSGKKQYSVNDYSNPVLGSNSEKFDFGGSIKYGLSSAMTLDFTFNPDFSQIEADAQIIDANNPFALFLQEKRPFFLEGFNSFRSPGNLVYTRAINNPLFAGKITGKTEKFDYGFMTAYDQNTTYIIPMSDRSFIIPSKQKSLSNIFRIKYDLGSENFIALTASDREFTRDTTKTFDFSGHNRVLGLDWRYRFEQNYLFIGQILGYNTKEINDTNLFNSDVRFGKNGEYTARFDGEEFSGVGGFAAISRSSRNWFFYKEFSYQPSTARKDNGFMSRNDYYELFFENGYSFYPEGKTIRKYTPSIIGGVMHDTEGKMKELWMEWVNTIEFTNGIYLYPNFLFVNNEFYRNENLREVRRFSIGTDINSLKIIRGGGRYSIGKYIVRNTVPYVGTGQNFNFYFTFLPIDRIRNDFSYSYSDVSNENGVGKLFAGYVINNTFSYQFNREFSCRLLFQYNSFDNSFNVDPLISYKWNPFTVLYVGSTHYFEEFSGAGNTNFHKESYRQIFMKFQYLLSM
ncbi:MAG: carbohydrate binding family 9 domain-containing protein [Ignavibacteria bacterium]|nr:carbohydrate binding family 9 domain-containing protein [Ignavibacteria bacterium]